MAQVTMHPPTDMERAMEKFITVYQRYAGKEGNQASMNYKEFEELMNKELGSFTKSQKNPKILQKIMKSVDGGVDGKKDGEIDFQEFLNLTGGMMLACHEALMKCPPSKQNPVFATKLTDMEQAMESIVRVFQNYAGKKGKGDLMDYSEFEAFMKMELASSTKYQKDPNIIRRLMESVDGSTDGKTDRKLNFQEFMNLIGGIMVACYCAFVSHLKGL